MLTAKGDWVRAVVAVLRDLGYPVDHTLNLTTLEFLYTSGFRPAAAADHYLSYHPAPR